MERKKLIQEVKELIETGEITDIEGTYENRVLANEGHVAA